MSKHEYEVLDAIKRNGFIFFGVGASTIIISIAILCTNLLISGIICLLVGAESIIATSDEAKFCKYYNKWLDLMHRR